MYQHQIFEQIQNLSTDLNTIHIFHTYSIFVFLLQISDLSQLNENFIFVLHYKYGIHVNNMYCIQICPQILYLFPDLMLIQI
jgi:hypothetical protein